MASVKPTITFVGNDTVKFAWALTDTNLDGYPAGPNHADYADRNFQVTGTLGGATVTLQGSNDGGTTWFSLTDPQGNAVAISTAVGGRSVVEVPELTRPLVSGASGTTNLTAYLVCRRSRG